MEHKNLKCFKGKREKRTGMDIKTKNIYKNGTSLKVQWLRLHLPVKEVWVRSLVGELRPHMSRDPKTKT